MITDLIILRRNLDELIGAAKRIELLATILTCSPSRVAVKVTHDYDTAERVLSALLDMGLSVTAHKSVDYPYNYTIWVAL
jgi:hypothetical protein